MDPPPWLHKSTGLQRNIQTRKPVSEVIAWQVHFGKLWCCRENANTKKSMIFLLRHHRFWFLEEVTHVPHLGIVKVPPFQLCAVKVVVFCAVTSKDLSNQCCRVLTRRRLLTTKGTHILQKILVRLSRWLGSNLPVDQMYLGRDLYKFKSDEP